MAEMTDVFFVDGMRTPFGRAGEKGMYWNTRADDLVVKAIIGLMNATATCPRTGSTTWRSPRPRRPVTRD